MTEILTESFCERCGTRYTFEPVSSRRKPLSAIGTLGRGIRHFVSDPGSSLDEAFAVARSESEQRTTATALEAFHQTFNFCLSCRQYTCADCWNTVEGRCLSCAPVPGALPPDTRVDIAVALTPMDVAQAPAPTHTHTEAPGAVTAAEAEADAQTAADAAALEAAQAWADEEAAALRIAEADAQAAAEAEAEARRVAEAAAAQAREAAEAEAAAIAAAMAEVEATAIAAMAEVEARAAAEADAQALADAEARAAADAEAASIAFQPGLNLDDQIAAYERELAEVPELTAETVLTDPEPLIAEPGPDLVMIEPEPEPVVVEAEPEPEPVVVEAEPEPVAASLEPIPTAIGQPIPASAVDRPLSWPEREVAAASYEPNWPDLPAPSGSPAAHVGAGLPAAEVMPLPAPARACPSCGLSLSASARFCRRCGTPQQVAGSN